MWIKGSPLYLALCLVCAAISPSGSESIQCSKDCTLVVDDIAHHIRNINDEECEHMEFKRIFGSQLSKFNILSFIYRGPYRSFGLLDMEFSEPKWNYLRMRIKPRNDEPPFCQELKLNEFKEPDVVELDCPRFCHDGQVLDIEYYSKNYNKEESRNYAVKIPSLLRIGDDTFFEKWQCFTYVDTTDIPTLIVHWQSAPKFFLVESYVLSMTDADTGQVVKSVEVPADLASTHMSKDFTVYSSGSYLFTVQPININKTVGFKSISAKVRIDLPSQMLPFIIAGVTFVVSVFVCVLLLKVFTPAKPPTVLMVYERSRQTHLDAMVALADYLRTKCYIDARIDETDVHLTDHMDPFDWCQEAFSEADAVMVLSSPPQVLKHEVGRYRNLGGVGLNLLAEHLCYSDKIFISVLLSYCSEEDIPLKAKNLRRFSLLKELNEMVWFLHQSSRFPRLSRFNLLSKCLTPSSKLKFSSQGTKLLHAFDHAAKDVREPLSYAAETCVRSELESLPEIAPELSVEFRPGEFPLVDNDENTLLIYPHDLHEVLSEEEQLRQISENNINKQGEYNQLVDEDSRPYEPNRISLCDLQL
ncbi:uncharacterized protein [Anabrus simplex]|uniref:uncharacterized protein isoform X1 n=1 Tax=Anabrus simplex TaxID=316456 RepID=UPI0035A33DC9